jgi:hypothetical protein
LRVLVFTERKHFSSFPRMGQKQAPGLAAALDRLMAQGGDRKPSSKGFTYTQGRLKGLTKDQAVQMGRNMWAGASDSVKDKYAKREMDLQAPIEKDALKSQQGDSPSMTVATGGSARVGQASAPRYASSGNKGPSFAELTKEPVMPAGEAQAIGNGATKENGYTATINPDVEKAFPGIQNPGYTAPATEAKAPLPATKDAAIEQAFPGILAKQETQKPAVATPAGRPATVAERKASDDSYATIADQRAATNYPEATREVPFTGADVIKAKADGFGTKTPRINPLTQLPIGYRSGDSVAPAQQAKADESVIAQQVASAPRAIPVVASTPSAPERYSAAQESYQSSKLDPAKAKEMDTIYKGANSVDQANITANSLKRAAALPTTVNAPRAIPVSSFAGPATPRRSMARR